MKFRLWHWPPFRSFLWRIYIGLLAMCFWIINSLCLYILYSFSLPLPLVLIPFSFLLFNLPKEGRAVLDQESPFHESWDSLCLQDSFSLSLSGIWSIFFSSLCQRKDTCTGPRLSSFSWDLVCFNTNLLTACTKDHIDATFVAVRQFTASASISGLGYMHTAGSIFVYVVGYLFTLIFLSLVSKSSYSI